MIAHRTNGTFAVSTRDTRWMVHGRYTPNDHAGRCLGLVLAGRRVFFIGGNR